ncbi:MAG: glycosyltransferase family 4 protein [Alphaproteobacteria bacterium]|nr:glycosyltransferase family 4 protein [Alphaproteobacteria bacterium]
MAEIVRAATRVVVHHPGSNHLAYNLVGGLQAEGYDAWFDTGFFYDPAGALARLVGALPDGPRARIERELKRRTNALVDPRRVHAWPWAELAYVAAARAGIGGRRLAAVVGWRNAIMDRRVARALRSRPPAAVIGHDGSALHAARAAREVGALAVLNQVIGHVEHGLALEHQEAALAPQFAESMATLPAWIIERHRAELAGTDTVIVPSDYVRDTLTARGVPSGKIAVIPYGVDVERFRPPAAPRPRDRFRMLFVGHLSQRKGIGYVLEAARRLKGLPGLELVLVGRKIGADAAFAPYADLFRYVSAVPFHEVHALFQDADVFVYPSLHEGSAFVTYEALASGLPVVTTPNAGSVVRDGVEGYVVPIRDVEALCARLEALHRDPELRARMSEAARARALDFTWAAYRRRIAAQLDAWLAAR